MQRRIIRSSDPLLTSPLPGGGTLLPAFLRSEIQFPPLPRGGLGWGKEFQIIFIKKIKSSKKKL